MNERERAEMIARAIDSLIANWGAHEQVGETEDNELNSLLRVARARLQTSSFTAKAGLQHEAAVWKDVLDRLGQQKASSGASYERQGPGADDDFELNEVAKMRRLMAQEAWRLAESHRQAVWDKIQSRLAKHEEASRGIAFLRRPRRRSDDVDTTHLTAITSEGLTMALPAPYPRLAMGPMAESAQELAKERVWARVRSGIDLAEVSRGGAAGRLGGWFAPRFALAAAALALIVAAVGPIPATGFAGHPAAKLAREIGDQVGVHGGSPPVITSAPAEIVVRGDAATAAEASTLAGADFVEPSAPAGFALASSMFYPEAISGGGNGTFVTQFVSGGTTLVVYQEGAGGSDLVVDTGSLIGVRLSDDTTATFIQGAWNATGGGLGWTSGADQTVLFERSGVRFIAELHGQSPYPRFLIDLAETLQ